MISNRFTLKRERIPLAVAQLVLGGLMATLIFEGQARLDIINRDMASGAEGAYAAQGRAMALLNPRTGQSSTMVDISLAAANAGPRAYRRPDFPMPCYRIW